MLIDATKLSGYGSINLFKSIGIEVLCQDSMQSQESKSSSRDHRIKTMQYEKVLSEWSVIGFSLTL